MPKEPSNKSKQLLVVDVETTGLNPRTDKLHGIGVAYEEDDTAYHRLDNLQETAEEGQTPGSMGATGQYLATALGNPDTNIIGHNLRFDMHFLSGHFLAGDQPIRAKWWDTKILAKLIDENRELGLKPLSRSLLGADSLEGKSELDRAISLSGSRNIADFIAKDTGQYTEIIGKYCEEDCNNTYKLFHVLSKKLKQIDRTIKEQMGRSKSPLDYYINEAMPLEPVLLRMEQRGVRVNLDRLYDAKRSLADERRTILGDLGSLCKEKITRIEDALYEAAVEKRKSERGKQNVQRGSAKYKTIFNWDSGQHLGWMIELHKLPTQLQERTKGGALKTDEGYFKHLQWSLDKEHPLQPVLVLLLRLKKVSTYLKTFIGEVGQRGLLSLVEGDRIFPQYLQVGHGKEGNKGGPVTGRLSSKSPNFQNIPRSGPFRSFFVPDDDQHLFWYADYKQVELRVAAHLSGDPEMVKLFSDPTRDAHQETANWVGIPRQLAKVVNFLIIYRGSAWRLKHELGDDYSVEDCQDIIDALFDRWRGLKRWQDNLLKDGHRYHAIVCDNGLVRRLPALGYRYTKDKEERRAYKHAVKQLFNTPIQSFAATAAKLAMIKLHQAGADIVNQTHDSIVAQVKKGELDVGKFYSRIMENSVKLSVPLLVDTKFLTSFSEDDKYEQSAAAGPAPAINGGRAGDSTRG